MTTEDFLAIIDTLCKADITKLLIDRKLRRKLKNAGYDTLKSAFAASNDELDAILDWNQIDELCTLRDSLEKCPSEFASRVRPIVHQTLERPECS